MVFWYVRTLSVMSSLYVGFSCQDICCHTLIPRGRYGRSGDDTVAGDTPVTGRQEHRHGPWVIVAVSTPAGSLPRSGSASPSPLTDPAIGHLVEVTRDVSQAQLGHWELAKVANP
jgi:hypothetical protein